MKQPIISICIPCYKRVEYVRMTLNSIYFSNDNVNLDEFEVIISDNDPNHDVKNVINEFNYPNLSYYPTICEGFMNSYHVLTYGRGKLLKLHNSQVLFRKGVLRLMLDEAKRYEEKKSLIFYTNGFLYKNKSVEYSSFDLFFYALSYWPSWSNGFSIWKDDFERIGNVEIDKLFPHTSVFVTQHYKDSYVINDLQWFKTQRVKGRSGHNKFEAFTIHFPALVDTCFHEEWIGDRTKKHVLHDIFTEFLPILLFNKYIARIEDFDITGYKANIKIYFPKYAFATSILCIPLVALKVLYRKFYYYINRDNNLGGVIKHCKISAVLFEERRAA